MDIRQAKQQIKNAMLAYFSKDEFGNYRLPTERQRPVFLLGAPGIGKTAIMEQIAQDLDVGFVSYSMTHHTRQSALGLPFIAKKTYDGVEYDVSEYTMSEIIAAVYDAMEATGKREGILFLDEINCVSETLTPAMLQFLQYKIFGRHRVPDGWIVVTAGNPPEYNRTAHDFDIATWDRLKRIDVEPDFAAWRDFAVETGVHPRRAHVPRYRARPLLPRGDHRGRQVVRHGARLGRPLRHDEAVRGARRPRGRAADRAVRAERRDREALLGILRPVHEVPRRLSDRAHTGRLRRAERGRAAREAAFDERVSLMGLITDALGGRLRDAVMEERAVEFAHGRLAAMRDAILSEANGASAVEGSPAAIAIDDANALPLLREEAASLQARLDTERKASLLSDEKYVAYQRALALIDRALRCDAAGGGVPFSQVKTLFGEMVDALDARIAAVSSALDNAFRFVEDAFGNGQEMLLLVTDLSVNRYGMAFINDHGCERYFAHNEDLLFYERGADLAEPHQPSESDRRRGLINELMFYIMKHIVFTGRVLP